MKEFDDENNDNSNKIEVNNDLSIMDIFYYSQLDTIPNNIKEDFKTKQNFVLVLANPRSGSQQGRLALNYATTYRNTAIPEYKIISFPIMTEKLKKKKSKDLEAKELNVKNNITDELIPDNIIKTNSNNNSIKDVDKKFDPLKEFSAIIFNILDKNEMESAKKFIKKYTLDFPNFKIKILIAGGDGTVLNIVEDLNKIGIDLNKCVFGAMPFGTGNDLSNALGFGNECKVGDIEKFQHVLYTYLMGTSIKIDVWELTVTVNQKNGMIFDVVSNGEVGKVDEKKNRISEFKKTFINYFSVGFDARVGFEFEQRRTSTRCCNKVIYALEAAKRIFCCCCFQEIYGLSELLDCFHEGTDEPLLTKTDYNSEFADIDEVNSLGSSIKDDSTHENKKFIFRTKNSGDIPSDIILKGNPVTLICQNIEFYMGGTKNIWEKSSNIGITQNEITKNEFAEYKKKVNENFQKQSFSDKKIEFFTYQHGIELGLEKVARGLANKVYQGEGPVFLEFKKNPSDEERVALQKVYLNCDGEFFHLENPVCISVKLNSNLCDGQINVLKNEIGL